MSTRVHHSGVEKSKLSVFELVVFFLGTGGYVAKHAFPSQPAKLMIWTARRGTTVSPHPRMCTVLCAEAKEDELTGDLP